MNELRDYTIAIMSSHNVIDLTMRLVNSLKMTEYRRVVMADGGLFDNEKLQIESALPHGKLEFYDMPEKDFGEFSQHTMNYADIIRHRPKFIHDLCKTEDHVLMMDADTEIVKNDFSLVNKNQDITISVREAAAKNTVFNKSTDVYPNIGVLFFNNPKKCIDFTGDWAMLSLYKVEYFQYEQGAFIFAMELSSFKGVTRQFIHCKYYNCYDQNWINEKTSVLHYKHQNSEHRLSPSFYGNGGRNLVFK